jgi:AraC-like DNA-binding protein
VVRQRGSAQGGLDWELAFAEPSPAVAALAAGYCGYHEHSVGAIRRRELPGPKVAFIIDFGPTLRFLDARDGTLAAAHAGGFVAGLDETFSLTESVGGQRGVQIDLTLRGAQQVLGVSMAELTGRVVALGDLFGRVGADLAARLQEAPDWAARFDLLDRFLAGRRPQRTRGDWVDWIVDRIETSGGTIPIERLAREVGYSRKHVAAQMRDRVGLAPKPFAKLVRFDRLRRALDTAQGGDLGAVAIACGYFDQAHCIREFRRYAGLTPGEFLRRGGSYGATG